jgi:hypothetical protein
MSKMTWRIGGLVLAGALAVGTAACGGDDDDDSGDSAATTEASSDAPSDSGSDSGLEPAATASDDFCRGFTGLDQAFANAPEDPAQLEAFFTEQVDPNVALVSADVPEEIGEPMQTMLAAVEQVKTSGDMSAFQAPEFLQAQGEVYPFLAGGCGFQGVEVTAVDFSFDGMPDTLEAGETVFTLTNDSQAGELHEMVVMKLADDADISIEDLFALPEEEAQQYLDPAVPPVAAFAPPGATGGVTADLAPGRYVYVCFIPTGTTLEAEGTGAPHFMEGMSGELTVS